jgi:2,5-diketo-D-gluconate reductase A
MPSSIGEHRTVTGSWSPLANGQELLRRPVLAEIGAQHGKASAQLTRRRHVQQGHSPSQGVVPSAS